MDFFTLCLFKLEYNKQTKGVISKFSKCSKNFCKISEF